MSGYAEGIPTVEVTLGGRAYTVGYTWGVKRRIREQLEKRGIETGKANEEEYLAITLWAGFDKATRDSISIEDIEELIHPGNEQEIVNRLQGLIVRSEPEPDPNAKPSAEKTPTEGEGKSHSMTSGLLLSTT